MSDKQEKDTRLYVIRQNSLNQAVELVHDRLHSKKRRWDCQNDEKRRKIMLHCRNMQWQRKLYYTSFTAFSKSLLVLEIKSHLANQNWTLLQRLFPFLPDYSKDMEYLMWRYALTILLYSPDSNSSHLQQFLEFCVGNQGVNDKKELEKLLLLPN